MANELLGSGAVLFINGYRYDVTEGEVAEKRSHARGDTTATGRVQVNVVDKTVVNFSFKAIRYSTINPHITGLFIAPTSILYDEADIIYYPNGANAPGGASVNALLRWAFRAVWDSYSENFRAAEGLISLSASGNSTGPYKRPGDA